MAELRVIETRPERSNRDVVEVLERCLAYAKRGDFKAIAVAGVLQDGGGHKTWSDGDHAQSLLGAVALLQNRLAADINGAAVEMDEPPA